MSSLASDLRERVRALPGMERLLPALDGLPPVFLVGGAVRDLLRGAPAVDLDLAVEGDGPETARALADRLGGSAVAHGRFGTATVRAPGLRFDLAATRRERYPHPGALPEVEAAPLSEDLRRRDFTINAMALCLTGEGFGRLHDVAGGRDDLEAGIVRVLHERSFEDDPTRLLRAVRYETRLGFTMDPDTEQLARAAATEGALGTVSGSRVADELLDLLAEVDAPAAVERLRALGLDAALHPALDANPVLVASAGLGAAETGANRVLAALAALCATDPDALAGWLDELQLSAPARDAVLDAARTAPEIVRELRAVRLQDEERPSRVWALLRDRPPETLALALALGAPPEPILRFASDLRHMRLEIGGGDLVAAGVPESPAIGRALEETLRRKLDGELSGRDEELRTALELARGDAA
jgi:tRNA nucleotidyltransferase (CCA-adding enzyme)